MSEPPSDAELDADLRRTADILGAIAAKFPPESDEWLAIRDAATALWIVKSHRALREKYRKLRYGLSDEDFEKLNTKLRSIGIDPDELDDDDDS